MFNRRKENVVMILRIILIAVGIALTIELMCFLISVPRLSWKLS